MFLNRAEGIGRGFRLPPPSKRDPYLGLSRGWYYKAAAAGEIKMVAVRQRNSLRGVRLIVYDSAVAYIRRADGERIAGEPGFDLVVSGRRLRR